MKLGAGDCDNEKDRFTAVEKLVGEKRQRRLNFEFQIVFLEKAFEWTLARFVEGDFFPTLLGFTDLK